MHTHIVFKKKEIIEVKELNLLVPLNSLLINHTSRIMHLIQTTLYLVGNISEVCSAGT